MHVLFFLRYDRRKASSRVRGYQLAEYLSAQGMDVEIINGCGGMNPLKFLKAVRHSDVIYFQKRYSRGDYLVFLICRWLNKNVIFDLDDAPAGLTADSCAARRALRIMRRASAVFAGSHALEKLSRSAHCPVYYIPSVIDEGKYAVPEKSDTTEVVIGWIGDGKAYAKDLGILLEPLRVLARVYPLRLVIAGALGERAIHSMFSTLPGIFVEIIDAPAWDDPGDISALLARFDIGVYPLIDNEFNAFKCGYKALEYMSMNIPVVASPVGEICSIVEPGKTGFLAADEQQWESSLRRLIADRDERRRMGKAGREKVLREYTLAVWGPKIREIILKLGKGKSL